eukprot:1160492-Pelagomonas_calceolata.AAC.12
MAKLPSWQSHTAGQSLRVASALNYCLSLRACGHPDLCATPPMTFVTSSYGLLHILSQQNHTALAEVVYCPHHDSFSQFF